MTMATSSPAMALYSSEVSDRLPHTATVAIFLSSYLTWRPSQDLMFTLSDAFFLLALIRFIYLGRVPLEPFRFLTAFWLTGFAILVGGLLIGSIAGPAPSRWLIVSGQYLFAWVVLPMILLRRTPGQTTAMIKAFIWGVFVMNLFGVIVYFTYLGTFEDARALFGQDFLSGGRRLGAFTGDANWNGAVLAMAVPFVIFLRAKALVGNLLAVVWFCIILLGIMLSASFTAFVSAVAAIAIFVLVGAVRPSPRMLLGSVSGLVFSAVLFVELGLSLPRTFVERVGNAIHNGDISEAGTFEGRMLLMREAWGVVEHHLLVGLGADQYRVVSAYQAPVHNMFLLLWAEGGLLSLLGWIVMLAVLFTIAVKAFSADRLATALTLSVGSTFVIASMASPHMYARLWAVPVLLAAAVSVQVAIDDGQWRRWRGLMSMARTAA